MEKRGYGQKILNTTIDNNSVFMEHVPETYPVLIYGNRYSLDEISKLLSKNNIAIAHRDIKNTSRYGRYPC